MSEQLEICKQNAGIISQDMKIINLLQNYNLNDYLLINTITSDIAPKLNGMTGFNRYINSLPVMNRCTFGLLSI